MENLRKSLYMEGLANEVAHLIQKERGIRGSDVMDKIEISLETSSAAILLALLAFTPEIIERCRIDKISLRLLEVKPSSEEKGRAIEEIKEMVKHDKAS